MKEHKIRNSLKASFWDGFFAAIQFGVVDNFAIPFALFLGANNFAVGLLSFIRNTLVSVAQLKTADLTLRLKSRKKLTTICVLAAALMWLVTFYLPFLFPGQTLWIFIILFGLTSTLNMFSAPAWASLMAEYIPAAKRGKYFGWRGAVLGLVYCFSILLAGWILIFFHAINLIYGFALLFSAAGIARLISWYFLTKMYEPRWQIQSADRFSFGDFMRRFPRSNFARFAVFAGWLNFGVGLAAPFFAVYILEYLKIGYFGYTVLMGAAVFTAFVFQHYWGRFADKYGNLRMINLTSWLIVAIPLFWIISSNFVYLLILQLLAGSVWAGFNLSSSNFIYDVAVASKRERCISYYNFLAGAGLGLGALCGGYLFAYLPAVWGSRFAMLFLLSVGVRFLGAVSLKLFTHEVRNVQTVRTRELFFDLSGVRYFALLSKELLLKRKS